MRKLSALLLASAFTFISSMVVADETSDTIKTRLAAVMPAGDILNIIPSPVAGLMEVELRGGKLLYVSPNGEFVIDGSLYQLANGRVVDLRQKRQDELMTPRRVEALKQIKDEDVVIFSPKGEVKATIYAFTDVDCSYCRKLHREMASYNDKGIEVKYLAYPRAGIGSSSYNKMVAIWCADDRQKAMTEAKAGKPIAMEKCDNPVADQFTLGGTLGVTGTPSLVTLDGQLMPGYLPADRLAQALGIN